MQRTLFAISATQTAFACFPWFGPEGTAGEILIKYAQTGDIFGPEVAVTFNFVCGVVEPAKITGVAGRDLRMIYRFQQVLLHERV